MSEGVQIRKLKNVDTANVSLVKRGANKKKYALAKSDGTIDIADLLVEIIKMPMAPAQPSANAMPFDEAAIDKMCADKGLDAQQCETFKAQLKLAFAFKDVPEYQDLLKDLPKLVHGVGTSAPADPEEDTEDPETAEDDPEAKPAEGETEDKPKPGKGAPPFAGDKEKPMVKKDDQDPSPTQQTTDTKVALEKADKKVAELEALLKSQNDAQSTILKKMQDDLQAERDERAQAEWVAKADRDLQYVPGKTGKELGEQLFKLEKGLNKEAAQTQFDTLKAMSDSLQKSALLTGSGAPSRGNDQESDAYAELIKKADSIIEKSDIISKGGTAEQIRARAMTKAIELFPALYNKYLQQNQAQTGTKRYAQ